MLQATIHNNQDLSQLIQQTNPQRQSITFYYQHSQAMGD